MQFVYVMNETDKDKMLELGYTLLRKSDKNNVWIFKNSESFTFADEDRIEQACIQYVLSDVLIF